MAGLADHLLGGTDHGGLPFHPACAVCRQARLAGALPEASLLSGRTKAGLAAGLIAAATVSPASVALAAPDFVLEPTEQGAEPTPDPGDEPEFDGGPVDEREALAPGDNLDALPDPHSPPSAPLEGGGGSQPPVETPASGPPAQTPGATAPIQVGAEAPDASLPAVPPVTPPATQPEADKRHTSRRADAPGPSGEGPGGPVPATVPAPPVTPQNVVAAGTPQNAPDASTTVADGAGSGEDDRPAAGGSDVHVVQRGESLWSIAKDLAGPGATNAKIASLVNRLWELNADSIGTGNPNLIFAGQKLRLPG